LASRWCSLGLRCPPLASPWPPFWRLWRHPWNPVGPHLASLARPWCASGASVPFPRIHLASLGVPLATHWCARWGIVEDLLFAFPRPAFPDPLASEKRRFSQNLAWMGFPRQSPPYCRANPPWPRRPSPAVRCAWPFLGFFLPCLFGLALASKGLA
jgi:hypothetical protein